MEILARTPMVLLSSKPVHPPNSAENLGEEVSYTVPDITYLV